jgi:hypothetical protein
MQTGYGVVAGKIADYQTDLAVLRKRHKPL